MINKVNGENKMDIVIKQADCGDINAINEIMRNSLSYWNYTQEELNKIMDLFKIEEVYFIKNQINLAYFNDALVGFFSFIKNTNNENELDCFYIKKDLIGVGYGKNMWNACCKKAKSLTMDNFIIMSTPDAEGFYQKMGAIKIGSRPSRVRKGIVMPLLKIAV